MSFELTCVAAGLIGCEEVTLRTELCARLRSLLLGDPPSWLLSLGQSTVAAAGEGVRLEGSCLAGTLIAVYPCTTYQLEDLPMMHQMILPGNNYVLARRDGVLLDGRPDGPSAQMFTMALQREVMAGRAVSQQDTRFSVGNKVNHPPPGVSPNVIVCPLDLFEDGGADLLQLLPVFHFRPPAADQPMKQAKRRGGRCGRSAGARGTR